MGIPKLPLHDNLLIVGKFQPHEGLTGWLSEKASPSFRHYCLSDSGMVPARWCGGQGLGPDPALEVGKGGGHCSMPCWQWAGLSCGNWHTLWRAIVWVVWLCLCFSTCPCSLLMIVGVAGWEGSLGTIGLPDISDV